MSTPARVLFVGDLNFYSKGASRLNALKQLGAEVNGLKHSPMGGDDLGYVPPSLDFKLAWKLGVHRDTEGVNAKIVEAVTTAGPDLLWIEKGNMINPATLASVRKRSPDTVIASYSDDDMFNKLNRTHAYAKSLKHYDVVFTTKSFNANRDELPALGARRCVMVDKAYDPGQHRPMDISAMELGQYGGDVGFIGSYAPERGDVLNYLADNGIQVRAWGNGWDGFSPATKNLQIKYRPLVNSKEDLKFSKGISATRINLGFLRKINRDLQTDRSVEIPACGGFMLAERSDEHERLFEDGREAVYFDSNDDLLSKVRYYLSHDEERKAIGIAGRARCETGGYSHLERMRFMLKEALGE
jgi:spore maturation protein CgeB